MSNARHQNALNSPTTAATVPSATVDAGANEFTAHLTTLQGQGLVAVASEGHLRVLDGQNHVMRDVHQEAAVTRPAWSPSGGWLSDAVTGTEAWVMTAEETNALRVGAPGLVRDDTVAWSPVADTLAMVTAAGVELPSPDGGPSRLLANTEGASSLTGHPG